MIKTRVVVASLLAAAALTACKSGDKLSDISIPKKTTTTKRSVATSIFYTPVTLADGTPVTLPNGTPVTRAVTSGPSQTATTLAPADLVENTGTTSVSTKPNVDHLALPKAGDYTFRDTTTEPTDAYDAHFRLTVTGKTVRTQQSEVGTVPGQASYYEETHRADGLFLVNSVIAGGSCVWSPSAASLPQSVIDGGTASTDSKCSTTANGVNYSFDLSVDLAFKAIRIVKIDGEDYRCIDITRKRVLKNGDSEETVESTDTYAFNLGLRIAVDEKITRKDGSETKTHRHKTVLTALPS